MNCESKLILITNPGSSSRKYALYRNDELVVSLHFEYVGEQIVCTFKTPDGNKKTVDCDFKELTSTVANIREILETEGYVTAQYPIEAIVARIVAPDEYFTEDHIIDDEFMNKLVAARERAQLHLPVVIREIEYFRSSFKDTPIIGVSDTKFQWNKPDMMKYYAFDTDLADKHGIKRYGYHGLSVESIVETMKAADILPEKLIVCHVGSGTSVSAVLGGRALDTSMGYSPLEGLMMATRSGSIDVAAALAIGRVLKLDNEQLEKYLNTKAGLLGVAGTDDSRLILERRDAGDRKAALAQVLYIYRIHSAIGHMAASLGGVDAIVFTATILERDSDVRNSVAQKLEYLGFNLDREANDNMDTSLNINRITLPDSKPIWVIKTDETREMARNALELLAK